MRKLTFGVFVSLTLFAARPAAAQTVTVTTTSDCTGCGSLRDAINAVNAGTANIIDATGVTGTITLGSVLPAIVNAVTLNAPSAGTLTINSGAAGQVRIDTSAAVTLNNLRIGDGLVKAGTGTLTLAGQQQYSGGTTVLAGTLAGSGPAFNGTGASLQG